MHDVNLQPRLEKLPLNEMSQAIYPDIKPSLPISIPDWAGFSAMVETSFSCNHKLSFAKR